MSRVGCTKNSASYLLADPGIHICIQPCHYRYFTTPLASGVDLRYQRPPDIAAQGCEDSVIEQSVFVRDVVDGVLISAVIAVYDHFVSDLRVNAIEIN